MFYVEQCPAKRIWPSSTCGRLLTKSSRWGSARGLGELSTEEFKAKSLKGLFPISEGLDQLEERGNIYSASSMRMLLQANQDDLRTIASRSPMSPVEVLANIRALSGVR